MDLSSALNKTAKFLFKKKGIELNVQVLKPSRKTLFRWICSIYVADLTIKKRTYRGTGGSNQLAFAFLKAFGEVCETIAMYENKLSSRCGMAAGIIAENSILRAKSELIERDAFIYHYRNRIPFVSRKRIDDDLHSFELASADKDFPTYFVTNTSTTNGASKCLQFGCGTSFQNSNDAIQKAVQEFVNIHINHHNFPNQCLEWWNHPELIPTKMDFHHVQSRDQRNLDIFKLLFNTQSTSRPQIDRTKWIIEELPSPAKFFKVFKVAHPDLQILKFGQPEPNTADLYHPFW